MTFEYGYHIYFIIFFAVRIKKNYYMGSNYWVGSVLSQFVSFLGLFLN